MKQDQYITLTGPKTTPADVCRWAQALFQLHARIAPRFVRTQPRGAAGQQEGGAVPAVGFGERDDHGRAFQRGRRILAGTCEPCAKLCDFPPGGIVENAGHGA